MLNRLLADLIVLVHLGFVVFVVAGGFLVPRWRWLGWLHAPAAAWGVCIELMGWVCPLTPLENRLRRAGGEPGYAGAFVEHYIVPVLYPAGLTRSVQVGLALIVIAANSLAYALVWRRRRMNC